MCENAKYYIIFEIKLLDKKTENPFNCGIAENIILKGQKSEVLRFIILNMKKEDGQNW